MQLMLNDYKTLIDITKLDLERTQENLRLSNSDTLNIILKTKIKRYESIIEKLEGIINNH